MVVVERGNRPDDGTPEPARDAGIARLFDDRGIVAGIVVGLSVLVVDKVLLIEKLMEPLPFYGRVLVLAAIVAFVVATGRTFGILAGVDPAASEEARGRFEVFHRDLVEGGTPAKTYNLWLGRLLGAVDRFFGDAGRNDPSLFARLIGLETPGPRWTAVAYDRCLLLALVYPIVVVMGVWAISGQVGPAEAALGLNVSASGWTLDTVRRWGWLLSIAALWATLIRALNTEGRTVIIWWITGTTFGIILGVFTLANGIDFNKSIAIGVILGGVAVAISIDNAIGFGVFAIFYAISFAMAGMFIFVIAPNIAIIIAFVLGSAVRLLSNRSQNIKLMGIFLIGFSTLMCVFLEISPYEFASLPLWDKFGAIFLFFGLFTLVNAPIDWIALGFTRALLRKGLQKQGWWPFAFALVDLVVAAGLVALLAFALVFAVQVFDDMAVLGGGPGARILPVPKLLAGLRAAPTAYEHWWVWAMLFSSMIPSFVNLTIASAAFLRGVPAVNTRVLRKLGAANGLPLGERLAISLVVSGQIALGALLGAAALAVAAHLLLPMIFGPFAETLLSFSEFLAEAEFPARLLEILMPR